MRIIAWLIGKWATWYAARRPPDFIIGTIDDPYVHRWWVVPRNRRFNIYLHRFFRDDDDRALHDHPWDNASLVLTKGYVEMVPVDVAVPAGPCRPIKRTPGSFVRRRAEDAHRVVLLRDSDARAVPMLSLFFTGRLRRTWGFWCPKGWRKFKDYVALRMTPDGRGVSSIGRGCGD